jgi:hypothetical protein
MYLDRLFENENEVGIFVNNLSFGTDAKGKYLYMYGTTSGKYMKWKAVSDYLDIHAYLKVHNHATSIGYAIEAKSDFIGTTTSHFGITSTAEWEPTGGTATAGGVQGLQGVARIKASQTITGGSLIGTYGQACNLGTINGGGVMVAALYGLIEDGGVYTAVSHVASLWLDSHLTQAVGGHHELLYMTNNGTTKMDSAIYLDPAADGSAFDYWLEFAYDQSPILTNALIPATTPDNTTVGADRALKVNIAGTPYYIPLYNSLHA